jgi:hypothetical protein
MGMCMRFATPCHSTVAAICTTISNNRPHVYSNCTCVLLQALQPTVGFSLLSDSLPLCPFFTLFSPPSYSHFLFIFFNVAMFISLFRKLIRFRTGSPASITEFLVTVSTLQGRVVSPAPNPKPGGPGGSLLVWSLN